MIPRRYLLLVTALLLCAAATSAGATSIVIVRTGREIVIGADSRQNFLDPAIPSCAAEKIRQVGNVFFAAAGIAGNGATGFNVHHEVTVAAREGGSMAAMAGRLEQGLAGKLIDLAASERRDTPEVYRREFAGKQLVSVVLAGMENGVPLLVFRGFVLREEKDGALALDIIRHACPQECQDVFFSLFLGEDAAIDAYLAKNPGFWMGGFAEGVRRLIEVEIAARPDVVGPPVTLLRITGDGARWLKEGAALAGKVLAACPEALSPP